MRNILFFFRMAMNSSKASAALDVTHTIAEAAPNTDSLHLPRISDQVLASEEAQQAISHTRSATEKLMDSTANIKGTLTQIRNAALLSGALVLGSPAAAAPAPSAMDSTSAEYLRLQISDPRALASAGWSPYSKIAALGGAPDIAFTPEVQAMLDAVGKVFAKNFSKNLTPAEQEKTVRYYQEGIKSGANSETVKNGTKDLISYYINIRATETFLKSYMETGVVGENAARSFDSMVSWILAGQPEGGKYVDTKKVQELSDSMNRIIDAMKKIAEQNRRDTERANANAEQNRRDIEKMRKEILETLKKIQSM